MKKHRIGKGLPRCIGNENDGFNRLYKKLGLLNRQHRKILLDTEFTKKQTSDYRKYLSRKRPKAGERDRLLIVDFYSNPNSRLKLWQLSYEENHIGEDENHSEIFSIPSLEHCILSSHIQSFSTDDNIPEINDEFAEWPDILEYLNDEIPWANLAGYVWSEIKRELDNWNNLTDDQRIETVLVIFAVATIVDDERLLSTAIQKAPELEDEFGILLSGNGDTERIGNSTEENDVVSQWNEFCEKLNILAAEATGTPPKVDNLVPIKFTVSELDKMEQAVRDHLANISLERLISHIDEIINKRASEEAFLWLDDTVRKQLSTQWLEAGQSLSPDQIKEEFKRLEQDIPDAFEHVCNLATSLSEVTQNRDNLRLEKPSNFNLRFSWEEEIYEQEGELLRLKREQNNARIELLSKLSPFGETFKLNHDRLVSPPNEHTLTPAEEAPPSEKSDIDERQLVDQAKDNDLKNVSDAVDGIGPDDQPILTADEHTEDNLESDSRPRETVTTKSTQVVDIRKSQSDSSADGRLELARTRVIDALLETPPRFAYVVQVGRLANRLSLNSDLPSVELFEAMLLSDNLELPDSVSAFELKRVFGQFPPLEIITDGPNRDLYAMLLLAGTLRPTLLARQSDALAFLTAIKPSERLENLYQLTNDIITGCEKLQGVRVDSSILRGVGSKADWQSKHEQLVLDVDEWKKQASYKTIKYAPATKIWQRWLKSDGYISQLLSPISTGSDTDSSTIEEMVTKLGDRKTFEELVNKTDRVEFGRRRGEDIHAGALNHLYALTREAVELALQYLSLNSSRPSQSNFLTNTLADIRGNFENLAPIVLDELDSLKAEENSLSSAAANSAIYTIKRFHEMLTAEYVGIDHEPDPKELVASGLFGFPSIHIDDNGMPEGDPENALNILLSTGQPEEYETAFEQYLNKGDIKTARRFLNWMEYDDIYDTEDIKNRLEDALLSETQKLRWHIDETRNHVEAALGGGYITDAERNRFAVDLVQLERHIDESKVFRFDLERNKLKTIGDTISDHLDSNKKKLKVSLNSLSLTHDSKQYNQILEMIEHGDLVTANELIDRVRDNEFYPVETQLSNQRQVFQEFYPIRSKEIDRELESIRNNNQIIDKIRNGKEIGGMALGDIPGAQRASAAQMLEAWYALKRANRLTREAETSITTLFTELGFIVQKVTISRSSQNFGEAHIVTDPLQARERCPIPAFGSSAKGQYRLVFLWGHPTEEDIIQHADDHSVKQPTIVLYLGRLSDARREGLSRISRERSRTLLVIDELLLVFLCGERDSRMLSLFSCAIPFTYVQPYVTIAGTVPPEMFYGREQEMREITNPHGSVFIYGGRQLGKTALLRAVERTLHQPREGNIAVFIDLKGVGIGHDRDAAEIWLVIWRRLRDLSLIPDEIKEPSDHKGRRLEDFMDYLCARFSESSGRSLFILLDEADKFLEVDARDSGISTQGYRESSRLKALMDRTGRTIKVVFAGLHNVLRTVKGANHPLGHFGQPIEVGPLLSATGWRNAEELIRQPLLVSGYRFREDSLITRILAQTNYYPSLIQLYGSELIKEMRSRQITSAPLYEIDGKILAQTYQNTNLREMIRSRFHLTLQLDPRYEVIAYSIAFDCTEQEDLLGEGIHHRRIDEAVRDWWPQGFVDIDPYTNRLRVLLDEMVGLGVLRVVDEQDGRYTLRNPNVLLLMGTKEEIAENLLKERELLEEFEREHFRAQDPEKSEHDPSRSPLTFQQEDLLNAENNGISLIYGLPAAGLDDVIPFLKTRREKETVIELDHVNDQREFEKELKRLHSKRPEGTTICVISHEVPWSEKWIQTALEQVDRLSARGRYLQIVFLTDPKHLWALQSELKTFNQKKIQRISLRPWRKGFLRHWMDEVGFINDLTIRNQVVEKTGGWKTLLERLYNLSKDTVNLENCLSTLENELTDRNDSTLSKDFTLDIPEPNKALQCLHDVGGQKAVTIEELISYLDHFSDDYGINKETLISSLEWAELLHLVHRAGHNAWRLDSIAARVISTIGH